MTDLGRAGGLFTAESVTEGHPDKVADQISDAILDACLAQDPQARVACETLVTAGNVILAGEITTTAQVDREAISRQVIADVGYTDSALGFAAESVRVTDLIGGQSPEIAAAVDRSLEARGGADVDDLSGEGAGDQGIMIGYATDETRESVPFPLAAAHRLARRLAEVRRDGTLPWLRPDGKTQVTVAHDEHGRPAQIARVVLSAQHDPSVGLDEVRAGLLEHVVGGVELRPWPHGHQLEIDPELVDINPAGPFTLGGPAADTGLTGRKLVVDAYGAAAPVGGGAFSGKDPTKVDRSAAYAARHVAVNLLAGGFASEALVRLSYAIGVAEPVSIDLETFGTSRYARGDLLEMIDAEFDLRPAAIRQRLGLNRPIYRQTAVYGHFGRDDLDLPWERRDAWAGLERRSRGFPQRTDQELVHQLNQVLASPGWVSAKGRLLYALRAELAARGLEPPIEERDGIDIFGHGRRYELADGEVREVTG